MSDPKERPASLRIRDTGPAEAEALLSIERRDGE
jgi:hypothetical protein